MSGTGREIPTGLNEFQVIRLFKCAVKDDGATGSSKKALTAKRRAGRQILASLLIIQYNKKR